MTNNENIPYEAPTLEIVGTLQDITKNGGLINSDDGIHSNNAFPNPVS